uniref:C2 domain-containing protein n=2 Tax=Macrostomum lignano TaxID=282301 RepID=A0A1I8JH01_9PLAT
MTDYSLKGFLQNGGQFPHQQRSRRRSNTGGSGVQRELERHSAAVEDGAAGKGRRMSLGSLSASRLSMASSIGSYNASTIQQLEQAGDLSHQGDDENRGKVLLSFHYNREEQLLTLKIIEAKDLRSVNGSEICAFATVSFLPTSSSSRLETKVRMLTSNPVWKEVFRIRNFLEDNFKEHKAFVIEVWDRTTGDSSTLIGEAVILLRSLTLAELEKGVLLWKFLSLDRQESELSQGELVFSVRQVQRKKRLTVKIERVNNAAIPVSATTPCLYMKLMLLRGHNVVLSDRTAAVTNSYNPVFNHKMRISLQSSSLESASLKLLLKQEPTARMANLRRGSVGSVQHYFQKTVGVIHLGADSEREDLREAWKQILSCKDKKLSFRLKFSTPRRSSTDN